MWSVNIKKKSKINTVSHFINFKDTLVFHLVIIVSPEIFVPLSFLLVVSFRLSNCGTSRP